MKIKTLFEKISGLMKIFKLRTKNKEIIDKKFDNLQIQKKLEFFKQSIFYAFPVFVIWTTMHVDEKLM